jgi:4-amino-4-deoxy-L-arabinose transferase-like glycosyltransferase
MTDRPRWWLIGVAALLAVVFLYESIGSTGAMVLFVVALAGFAGYRFYRARNPGKGHSVRCLTCGETLSPTARQCKYCGSARWTVN